MTETAQELTKCAYCGMTLGRDRERPTATTGRGVQVSFCCSGCREQWLGSLNRPKGKWGRYLDRLARSNDKAFGRSGPKCH